MKPAACFCFLLFLAFGSAQAQEPISPFDGRYWGVVLEHPDTKKIQTRENIQYANITRPLRFDLYLPVSVRTRQRIKTVVILNGIGDQPGQSGLKDSPASKSWGRLLAAHGFAVVTMESSINHIQESFGALFQYLADNSHQLHIDTGRIGVQAFSANCREVLHYLMREKVSGNIKAAVLYYAASPPMQLREDLPVYFVVAEKDIRDNNYGGLWQNVLRTKAPWTITIARDMPHGFDIFSDTETSQRVIMSTVSFWKDQLGEPPARMTPFSREREIMAATYEGDQRRKVHLMREWMRDHPDSNDAFAFSAFAAALMDSKNFEEAEGYLKKAIALRPHNKGNYLMAAVVSYALGRDREGDQHVALYEEDSTPEAFTYFYMADRLLGIKKYDKAAALYERALTFPNPGSFIYYNLGASYAMLGDRDKAFENLFKAADGGFGTRERYVSDEKLKGLHDDLRWPKLVESVNE